MAQKTLLSVPHNLDYMKVANMIRSGDPGSVAHIVALLDRDGYEMMFDEFDGDLIADEWTAISSTSTAAVASSLLTVTQSATTDTYYGAIGALRWTPSKNAYFQCRMRFRTIPNNTKVELGFTDSLSNAGLVNVLGTEGEPALFTGSDGAVLCWDVASTPTHWCGAAPRATGPLNKVTTDQVPVGATYHTFGVKLSPGETYGSARFFIDGRVVGVIDLATTNATALAPIVFCQSRGEALIQDIDYVMAIQSRRT